jgi:GMP synthase-like glutamine amidotransferase
MMHEKNIFLIIDPFLKYPAREALNTISYLYTKFIFELKTNPFYLEYFFPLHSELNLAQVLEEYENQNTKILGVISFGSYANITQQLEVVNKLGIDLKEKIIEKSIPFLGICFSHQLLAHIYGAKVDFIDSSTNPPKRWEEFRKIFVVHDKIKQILQGSSSFISMASHEQEVKEFNTEIFELTCTSPQCKIEGLMHKYYPAFSFQSHPEYWHESKEGWEVLYKFMKYFYDRNNF